MALVQFGGDQKSALESHRIVSLDRQGDLLEKIHIVLRESPVTIVNLQPSSDRNAMPVVFIGPRVSKARGWKMSEHGRGVFC